jgi:hypothetical protein
VGPYLISEKLSSVHVKLHRLSDGKTIKNRIHINILKRGTLRFYEFNEAPPENIDAVEPAILGDD